MKTPKSNNNSSPINANNLPSLEQITIDYSKYRYIRDDILAGQQPFKFSQLTNASIQLTKTSSLR
ncbi:hypothetical protein K3495_g10319 [Podosphaera aphanis]|nr:hypothetical protein K3495_g10319 [Podosphaera aphanis]